MNTDHFLSTRKHIRRFRFLSVLFLLLSALLLLLGRFLPGFADGYRRQFYLPLSSVLMRLSGLFPFSLAELWITFSVLLLLLTLLSLPFRLYRWRKRGKRRVPHRLPTALLFNLSLLFFLYTLFCGVNYHAGSFRRLEGLQRVSESDEEKKADLGALVTRLTELLKSAEEDAASSLNLRPGQKSRHGLNPRRFNALSDEARESMERLSESYPSLRGSYPRLKPVLLSRILSMEQITGVYTGFTVEANVNREIPEYNLPFTMCHELSHLRGFMQEEEANFIGFLACFHSEYAYFRYSALLNAYVYAGNELYRIDPALASGLYEALPENARQDLQYNSRFWAQWEGPVARVSERMNDSYLKFNGQSEGVISYDLVTELLLGYYKEGKL